MRKGHIKKKNKISQLYCLLGRTSKVSVHNKLLVYKQVLKPIVPIIQRFQNNVLRIIMNCPWFVRNADLQRDIGIDTATNVINHYAIAHSLRLSTGVSRFDYRRGDCPLLFADYKLRSIY